MFFFYLFNLFYSEKLSLFPYFSFGLIIFFCFCFSQNQCATNTALLNHLRISDECQMSPSVFNVSEFGKGWKCAIFLATDETVQCFQAVSLVTEGLMCYPQSALSVVR